MIKNKKSKKSQGHIEMILSFTIFLGFLIVLFIFLNPFIDKKTTYSSLDKTETILLENISAEYEHIALILKNSRPDTNCFSVANSFNISSNTLIIDENNKIVGSLNTGSVIYITPNSVSPRLYRIYFSNDFINLTSQKSCTTLPASTYSFGVMTIEKSVLSENLNILNRTYLEDYNNLKSELSLTKDFEFIIYNLNQSKVLFDTTGLHKIKSSDVLARDIPLRIINKSGYKSDILLNLRVW